jgi:transcription-repair coupling factor (superfamily II helicase)
VGRSPRQAFAYLIVPHGQAITDAAVRRLSAIQEFVELGAGFQIAMRDMEIRGTGNILGREQHGAMIAIGFELYCDLLQRAVRRLKGEQLEAEVATEIKWPIDAFVPEAYVPIEAQRLGLYKRLAQVRSLRAVRDLEAEMRDRFGPLPDPAQALVELAAARVGASLCGIARIVARPRDVRLEPAGEARSLLPLLERAARRMDSVKSVRLDGNAAACVTIEPPARQPLARLGETAAFLRLLAETAD